MFKTLEIIWLIMSVFGLSGIVYKVFQQEENSQIGFFVIFSSIAVIMYLYRRRQRLMTDKAHPDDTSDKYH